MYGSLKEDALMTRERKDSGFSVVALCRGTAPRQRGKVTHRSPEGVGDIVREALGFVK